MPKEKRRSPELETALRAAKAAGEIIRGYYRSNLAIETKADRTPVTQADVECERAIRGIVLERFPAHGFFGEETGQTRADAEFLWLVDPIDGTKGFIRGYPFFSTEIALMRNGELILGVSNGVMFNDLAWAERGQGAWLNGEELHVSNIEESSLAVLSTGNLRSLASSDGWRALGNLVMTADRVRGYGDFYHYHLLAAGRIDAVIESDVNVLDIAALSVIVTEAGGVFTDLDGNATTLETTSVLAANRGLHGELLKKLKGFV